MYSSRRRWYLSRCLADAFLAGDWDRPGLEARGAEALEPRPAWMARLVRSVLGAYPRAPRDRPRELAAFVAFKLETAGWRSGPGWLQVRHWFLPDLEMGRRPWPVPELISLGELAAFLDVDIGQLDWLADSRSLERTASHEKLRNYRYRWLSRRGGPVRVIEEPKSRLKAIQRRLLHEILDLVPAHDAAHGFTRGRSALTNASAHAGQPVIVSFDLEDFFASVSAGRVFGLFRSAGYPEPVAHSLTALTTNAVPVDEWAALPRPTEASRISAHHRLGRRLAAPHLPQGAPASPALANLAAFRLDRRMTGLAEALGATYTRYADDLTLSGSRRLLAQAGRLGASVATIAREEGFLVNHRKSTVATRAARQQVCGIVVNQRLNVPRAEYDELKALLHNAARRGAVGENRSGASDFRAHVLGRIAWIESLNPGRGSKLRAKFDQVDWAP